MPCLNSSLSEVLMLPFTLIQVKIASPFKKTIFTVKASYYTTKVSSSSFLPRTGQFSSCQRFPSNMLATTFTTEWFKPSLQVEKTDFTFCTSISAECGYCLSLCGTFIIFKRQLLPFGILRSDGVA